MTLLQFLDIQEKIIPQTFWDEISIFSRIVISVSGGIDSTIVFLEFVRQGIDFELVWNNTLRSMKTARHTLIHHILNQGYPFTILYPHHSQKMITKKTKVTIKRIIDGEIQLNKKTIPCCYYLKEAPWNKWLKENTDNETLMISGLAPYEGMQRNIRLGELRNRNTYLRFLKSQQRWFAYPLRDYNYRADRMRFEGYLNMKGVFCFRSGCNTCPIVAIYEEEMIRQGEDPGRVERSKKVWLLSNDA